MAVNLFWYGCNMTRHAEIIRLSERLLECVGTPAQPVGGPGACCGSPKESEPRINEAMAARTMDGFAAREAERVVTWCPSCHMNLEDFMAPVKGQGFRHAHLCEALHEGRDALARLMTQRVPARAMLDAHVGFNDRVDVNTLIPDLLRLVPGVEMLDHPYRGASYMCFGLANVAGALPAHKARLLAAAREAGADTIVTIFHSCHREIVALERDHGIRVVNWVHLLAEGAGWPYRDDYKEWRNAEDPAEAIGEARMVAAGEEAVKRLALPELTRPR
ncbi:heterodisulfide reductase-related iron-sulfur binding cluster [Sabulicella glaciei]|uniref:Heterodisulfide reductase-related iron-sulfur binding cluster n=1 Tax=Sabulicella glaciei TaxID=2984948 RepID=A0ABT3NVQ3_9PROT|nr:heterodisulfide reductase-related iron-sulfur binding cluster [Roseococcus sp. MDT2-1-1]MCW8086246.1 heterodisulfide reductase-related iron-sulfur binding cluster [Roseococcus sp. MDT2-1-1]